MRDATIDILKGIGIILVLVCHRLDGYIVSFSASFHIPLFFLVAGYFSRVRAVGDEVKIDFRRLFMPYFFTVCIMVVGAFVLCLFGCVGVGMLHYAFDALIYGNASPGNFDKFWGDWAVVGSVWFLAALFWAKVAFNVLLNYVKKGLLFVVFGIGGLATLLGQYVLLPYSILQGISVLPFLYIGYRFRTMGGVESLMEKFSSSNMMRLLFGSLIVCWFLTTFGSGVNIADCTYSLFYYPNVILASVGTLCVYFVSCAIYKYIKSLAGILSFLGRYSIILVCFPVLESFLIPLNSIIPDVQYKYLLILICKVCWCVFAFVLVFNVSWLRKIFGVGMVSLETKV